MQQQMINQILGNFAQETGIKAKWAPVRANNYQDERVDGIVQFTFPDRKLEIATETRVTIQYVHLPGFLNQQTVNDGLLVLAKYTQIQKADAGDRSKLYRRCR